VPARPTAIPMSAWSSIPRESMVKDISWGGVTEAERRIIVIIAWILESRPMLAREPTRAVSIDIHTTSCQRSWPTRAQMKTTRKAATAVY